MDRRTLTGFEQRVWAYLPPAGRQCLAGELYDVDRESRSGLFRVLADSPHYALRVWCGHNGGTVELHGGEEAPAQFVVAFNTLANVRMLSGIRPQDIVPKSVTGKFRYAAEPVPLGPSDAVLLFEHAIARESGPRMRGA